MNNSNTALLIMDVQPGVVDRLDNKNEYLARVTSAVNDARKSNVTVIYVVVGFRPGFPEVSPQNQSFSALKNSTADHLIEPQPALKLSGNDLLVIKRRVSAFSGSDLEVLLRGQGIRQLVLSGIATSGVVLSTLREAADKDYIVTVLADLCADFDDEVHRVLTEKVFPRQATVMTSDVWAKSIETKKG